MKASLQRLVKIVLWLKRLVGLGGSLEIEGNVSVAPSLCVGEIGCRPPFWYEVIWSKRFIGIEGWDAVLTTFDSVDGVRHEVIGTYHGWDSRAIYIGGYNKFNPREGRPELSATERVHFGKERATIYLDTGKFETKGGVEVKDENGNLRAGLRNDGAAFVGFDFLMARTIDGDFNWKRALVPWPTKLEINFNRDFQDGVKINGPVEIDGELKSINGFLYPPVVLSKDKPAPSDVYLWSGTAGSDEETCVDIPLTGLLGLNIVVQDVNTNAMAYGDIRLIIDDVDSGVKTVLGFVSLFVKASKSLRVCGKSHVPGTSVSIYITALKY